MPIGVLSYHLDFLVERGLLSVDKQESFSRYFPGSQISKDKQQMLSALRQEIPRGIIVFLLMNPGATHGKILENFAISGGTLSYHIKKLVARGVVRLEKVGRESRMTVVDPDKVADLLIVYRRSFLDRIVDEFVASYVGAPKARPAETPAAEEQVSEGRDSTGSSPGPQDPQDPDRES